MSPEAQPAGSERKYRRKEASEYLKQKHGLAYTSNTLAKMACCGGGPPFFAGPRFPLYPESGLDEWAAEKLGPLVRSTSEAFIVAWKPAYQDVKAQGDVS